MSASTIQLPASRTEHGGMVNELGYAYCLDCRPLNRAQWLEAGGICGVCDGCGRDFTSCTPIEITGMATVEYPRCKVF